ncbi:putative lipoprotein [Bordetella pertussis STO1-CHOC-0018]|nr:putative lipoprotein [Bordetella pertussis STO1-CHOC-0018]
MTLPFRNCSSAAGFSSCEDSIGCMHGSSEPDLRNWKSPPPSSLKEPGRMNTHKHARLTFLRRPSGALYPSPDSTWTNTTY